MKVPSAKGLGLIAIKNHDVTRLCGLQAPVQTLTQQGRAALTFSPNDAGYVTQVVSWARHSLESLLQVVKNQLHSPAWKDSKPSSFAPLAQLFLLVLNDNSIHPLVRIWYARLQWPVVQLATADPKGFQSENHPARRLIYILGEYALGQGAQVLPCGSLEQEIQRLVLLIENAPQAGRQVFERACHEFDLFLESTRSQPQPVDCSACLREQQEALTLQYQKAILDKLMNAPIQNAVRDFATQVWAQILAAHAVRLGMDHPETLKVKQSAFELIQISSNLLNPNDRKKAMGSVPQLMQDLRSGMTWMGIALAEQDLHIQHIGGNLSDAFIASEPAEVIDRSSQEKRADGHTHKFSFIPKIHSTAVDGLLVSDENTDFDWYLWECAITEQAIVPHPAPKLTVLFTPRSHLDTNTGSQNFWETYPGDLL